MDHRARDFLMGLDRVVLPARRVAANPPLLPERHGIAVGFGPPPRRLRQPRPVRARGGLPLRPGQGLIMRAEPSRVSAKTAEPLDDRVVLAAVLAGGAVALLGVTLATGFTLPFLSGLAAVGSLVCLTRWRAGSAEAGLESGSPPDSAGLADAEPLVQAISDLSSPDAAVVQRALARTEALDASLMPHVLPLLARHDIWLGSVQAFQRALPRVMGQLVDALLDPRQSPVVRRRIPQVLKDGPAQKAADALVLGLQDESFEVRYECGAALASIAARSPSVAIPADVVLRAALADVEQAPPASRGRGGSVHGSLEHVVNLLSLLLDRPSLQFAQWTLRSQGQLAGGPLERLENALPDNLRPALRSALGTSSRQGRPTAAA